MCLVWCTISFAGSFFYSSTIPSSHLTRDVMGIWISRATNFARPIRLVLWCRLSCCCMRRSTCGIIVELSYTPTYRPPPSRCRGAVLMWHSVIWYQFLRCDYMIFTCSRHIPICRYVPTFSSASINTHVFTPHLYSSAKPLRSVPSSSQIATVDRYTHQIIARCPTKNQSPTMLRRRKRKIMKKRLMVRCTKVLLSLGIARMN